MARSGRSPRHIARAPATDRAQPKKPKKAKKTAQERFVLSRTTKAKKRRKR